MSASSSKQQASGAAAGCISGGVLVGLAIASGCDAAVAFKVRECECLPVARNLRLCLAVACLACSVALISAAAAHTHTSEAIPWHCAPPPPPHLLLPAAVRPHAAAGSRITTPRARRTAHVIVAAIAVKLLGIPIARYCGEFQAARLCPADNVSCSLDERRKRCSCLSCRAALNDIECICDALVFSQIAFLGVNTAFCARNARFMIVMGAWASDLVWFVNFPILALEG